MPEQLAIQRRDAAIARQASRQHGVICFRQLIDLGLTSSSIQDRVNAGRFHRVHRGVYAVGHPNLSNEGTWMAAVLACGGGTVLSHRSAGALWRMLDPIAGAVDVTVEGHGGRARRNGIRLHRSKTLSPRDCTRRANIPVTTPTRTLADLRRILPQPQFNAAVREAEFRRLPLRESGRMDRTRTELEAMFLGLCRRHRLPQPEVNVLVDHFEVDFLWRDQRLIVEVDGWESHRTRSAFEEDRARDAHLKVRGYEVLRFTWRQVEQDAAGVAETVRAMLRR